MLIRYFFPDQLPTIALFAELLAAAMVVIFAGWRFTKLADIVAERLNLGAGWVGLILLATVTSLPELVTGSTATTLGNVDLAMGGILGSCAFNITIIFLLNAFYGGGSVLTGSDKTNALSSSFGLLLIGLTLMGLVLMDKFADAPRVAQITEGLWALLIAMTYLGCIRLIYHYEKTRNGKGAVEDDGTSGRRPRLGRRLIGQVLLMAGVLVVASWWLAKLGDVLSKHEIESLGRPLGATFVGAFFLALATSLPEIATSVAAVKLGKIDLALGNIFGSNMFNIFVIPILKGISFFGMGQPIMLSPDASNITQNLITGLLAILLTTVAIGGIAYQSKRKMLRRFGFDSIVILVVYVGGMALLMMGQS